MIEDHDKIIWAGTYNHGVFYFNPCTGKSGNLINDPNNKNSLSTNTINTIYEDSNHNIWFSTEGGGLCRLSRDRNVISRYTTRNGLPSNFIFKVLEDNQKNLWVSTSKGLVRLNAENGSTVVYTKANGLLNDQFNYNSGYKDSSGKMYFGSVKGMITFWPDDFFRGSFVPPVYITGFQVQNKELSIHEDSSFLKKSILYTEEIMLPYDHSSFSIDFSALSYTAPEMTEYHYIMEGLDNDWTYLKSNRKVYFTDLSPGTYIFKVKAAVNGLWNKEEKRLFITILPPFWATGWALFFYALLSAALSYYLIRSYHMRIEEKKEKEIYKAKIDFFTNVAHEIRTPLTLIKGPVENLLDQVEEVPGIKEDVVTLKRSTNRLIALVTQILDFRQTETKGFSLDFSRVDISELLQETYVSFQPLAKKKNLVYTMDLPANSIHALADAEALNKIFSNLFSNAVKYAQKEVRIRLYGPEKEDWTIRMEIANDGHIIPAEVKEKIFEPFFRLKETGKQKGTGIGLTLARSLAELHNGSLFLKDAKDRLNTFSLCLPVQPEKNTATKQQKTNAAF